MDYSCYIMGIIFYIIRWTNTQYGKLVGIMHYYEQQYMKYITKTLSSKYNSNMFLFYIIFVFPVLYFIMVYDDPEFIRYKKV